MVKNEGKGGKMTGFQRHRKIVVLLDILKRRKQVWRRGGSAVERELGKEGHRKGLWHMVIVKPLWRALQEHTVAPEAMAHRLLRRMVEHLQERMACRETQLEARAEDMRDPVTKRLEMALIRYNPKITEMEVRRRPDWRPRRSGGETGMQDREGDEQRERLMARRRKRIRQI